MSRTIENAGHYEYKCLDGSVLRFRTMSAKERRKLFFEDKRWNWIIHGLSQAEKEYDPDLWDRHFARLAEIIGVLGQGDTHKKFVKLRNNLADTYGVIARINQVELALNDGEEIPDQENLIPTEDEVDDAAPPELEKLGEESPAEDHTQTT